MKTTAQKIVNTSIFAAMVAGFTFIKIEIPIGGTATMIHLGNVFCILSGIILGPIYGGLAAGIGSFLFDICSPSFFISAPFSLVFKFIMAFSCGIISNRKIFKKSTDRLNDIIATIFALIVYNFLHISKIFIFNRFLIGMPHKTTLFLVAKSSIVSSLNAAITLAITISLLSLLKKIHFQFNSTKK